MYIPGSTEECRNTYVLPAAARVAGLGGGGGGAGDTSAPAVEVADKHYLCATEPHPVLVPRPLPLVGVHPLGKIPAGTTRSHPDRVLLPLDCFSVLLCADSRGAAAEISSRPSLTLVIRDTNTLYTFGHGRHLVARETASSS